MNDLRAARRYSQAIYGLAESAGTLDSVDNELEAAVVFFKQNPDVMRILSNSTIAPGAKEDFIAKAVPPGTSPMVVNFFKVLIKKKRFSELNGIQKEFHQFYERKRNVEEVTAITAVSLSPENVSKLQNVLGKKLNSSIRLVQKVDPRLIGGLVIRYAGNEINAGFRSRLDAIGQLLNS